ncbi:hypothetical protein F2Q70_00041942 [Brassica cretica]|uniref:Uncharacterized protein n=1 Tax=Brassica cretica TaxID=69181 RepID=A0A8S9KE14_BRACR|nr:hypothetical protein F2Q70_00041942 [Brassica cretica]
MIGPSVILGPKEANWVWLGTGYLPLKEGQAENFKQIQKLCMPFLKFKKDEAIAIGGQALNLKLPFGEMEVLQSNMDLIKRQLGLEEVEIYSASDPNDVAKAGPHASLLKQNPPSPGSPTAIFLNSFLKFLHRSSFAEPRQMYVLAIALLFRHSNTGFEQTSRKIEFRFEEAE